MFNDHKQYIDWLEGGMCKRLRRDFGVAAENITCAGKTDDGAHHVVICMACRLRHMNATRYLEPVDVPVPYRVEFSVDLVPHYRMIDNVYTSKVWLILAGQCADCGHVYFIYMLQKEGNPYIGTGQGT